jgi:hypothetical protein
MRDRDLEIGTQEYTKVVAMDEPDHGGANHVYAVKTADGRAVLARFVFQSGPVGEYGINGIHNEDLICIVIDRLSGFQKGKFRCHENAVAIRRLHKALNMLKERTERRKQRNVEGTSAV